MQGSTVLVVSAQPGGERISESVCATSSGNQVQSHPWAKGLKPGDWKLTRIIIYRQCSFRCKRCHFCWVEIVPWSEEEAAQPLSAQVLVQRSVWLGIEGYGSSPSLMGATDPSEAKHKRKSLSGLGPRCFPEQCALDLWRVTCPSRGSSSPSSLPRRGAEHRDMERLLWKARGEEGLAVKPQWMLCLGQGKHGTGRRRGDGLKGTLGTLWVACTQ